MGVNDEQPPTAELAPRASAGRPAYRNVGVLALIAGGGAAGTAVRAVIEEAVPPGPGGWPWATFGINVTGALLLGLLLQLLVRTGADSGWRRNVRLTAGTGFLGGYTTYSTFAVEVSQLVQHGTWAVGVGYAVSSSLLGAAAAAAGYALAGRVVGRAAGGGSP
ncbi:MAG: fluoride efflux transporter FluC [Dermatophilaceae bacterium]